MHMIVTQSGVNYFFHQEISSHPYPCILLARQKGFEECDTFDGGTPTNTYFQIPITGILGHFIWGSDELNKVYEIPFSTIWIIWDLIRTNDFSGMSMGTCPLLMYYGADLSHMPLLLQSLLQI